MNYHDEINGLLKKDYIWRKNIIEDKGNPKNAIIKLDKEMFEKVKANLMYRSKEDLHRMMYICEDMEKKYLLSNLMITIMVPSIVTILGLFTAEYIFPDSLILRSIVVSSAFIFMLFRFTKVLGQSIVEDTDYNRALKCIQISIRELLME